MARKHEVLIYLISDYWNTIPGGYIEDLIQMVFFVHWATWVRWIDHDYRGSIVIYLIL